MLRYVMARTQPWKRFATFPASHCWALWHRQFSSQSLYLSKGQYTNLEISSFNSSTYANVLQNCIKNRDFIVGKALHCDVLKRGGCLDLFGQNILLNLYVKSELLHDAVQLFDEISTKNVVSFVTLLQGHLQAEEYVTAVELFNRLHREGHELNPFVFTTILKVLVGMDEAEMGWNIHACIYKLGFDSNPFVSTSLIDAYSVSGLVDFSRDVFNGIIDKDMVSWTGIITCYAENDYFEEALGCFSQMRLAGWMPNNYTFTSVIKACLSLLAIDVGKSVHGCVLKTRYEMDPSVGISLLDLYCKSGDLNDAACVFQEIPERDVVHWSFIIARYSQSDRCDEALKFFSQMRRALIVPNQFTFASVLQACASVEALDLGMQIHCYVTKFGLDSDVFVRNALMDVYSKCGKVENTVDMFLETENINDVSWNTIIVGHVQCGDGEKALALFIDMHEAQGRASSVTYSSLLRACATLAALEPGLQIHSFTIKTIYDQDLAVGNALVDMYAKCGSIKDARLVFEMMIERDVVSWNAMVSAYSMHGLGNEALSIFERMRRTHVKPNQLTFLGVLSACSNSGSLNHGYAYLSLMLDDYGIEPCVEHYTCMVSLLGRLGHFDKARKLIEDIPFEPSVMVWRALLGACVLHNEVDLGKTAAQRVLELEPQDETTYVLLSNMYATSKRWNNVAFVRKTMKKKRLKKEPGLSWVENQGSVHYFSVGDASHPDIKLIHGMLEWLNLKSKGGGYVPNSDVILLDVDDDEKIRLLWLHSERLALAFALVRMPPGSPIRIIKNLRICLDCHAAIKFISTLVQREIVIRDINRFHHFQSGACSCGDYW
ncbi:putative pentatricopeptide repeat-containing protein At5g13230, mitochondrial [Solanum lycopersicum]|uniref:putative pentatricopeptide repeat-containing protein At5g13230, mitochondrial n=1 Tax=Solanum lycopersicum TaxID=4081 RepID=UPI003747BDFF